LIKRETWRSFSSLTGRLRVKQFLSTKKCLMDDRISFLSLILGESPYLKFSFLCNHGSSWKIKIADTERSKGILKVFLGSNVLSIGLKF